MNVKTITMWAVGLVVGLVLVSGLILPAVDASQNGLKTTFDNAQNEYRYTQDGIENYIFATAPAFYEYTINGEPVNMGPYGTAAVIATDVCRIQMAGHYMQIYDLTSRTWNVNATNQYQTFEYDAATKTLTATAYNGVTASTGIAQQQTYEVKDIVYLNPKGTLAAFTPTDSEFEYYIKSIDPVCAGGVYTAGTLNTEYFAVGNGGYSGEGYTISADATIEAVDGYKDLYKASGYTVSVSDGSVTEEFTPYTVYVPAKVIAYSDTNNVYGALIGVIPLLGIIALIIFAAGAIRARRA